MKRFAGLALLAAVAVFNVGATRGNWNATIVDTPEGWHRLGNPDAKVKLIEFVSYTCTHCGHFEKDGGGALKLVYLTPGHVSIEVRNVIRDQVDLAAALTVNCSPRNRFFLNHSAMLLNQPTWLQKWEQAGDATKLRWRSGTFGQKMRAIAGDLGFYKLMETRGVSGAQLDKCLSDEANAQKLIDRSNAALEEYGIEGTPSFVINGELVEDAHTWEELHDVLDDILIPKRNKA